MPRPRKPKQAPSETYAARSARGRPQVSLSVPQEWLARIDAAVHAGRAQTRSALVVAAVDAWLASSDAEAGARLDAALDALRGTT